MDKQIVYQNFVIRIFSFIPFVFILSYIEYCILNKILSDKAFFLVSAILMIIFACIYLKCSKKLFLKQAIYNIQKNKIYVKKNKSVIILAASEIQDIEIKKIYMYGISVAKLTIKYCSHYKNRNLVFYSKDLTNGQADNQGFLDFYNDLNKLVSCL